MIYITSDFHFNHQKEFIYEPRGFHSSEEMNEVLLENYNSIVRPEDEVYILGDLMLNDTTYGMECLKQIKCQDIHIIFGNHDTNSRIELYKTLPNICVIGYATLIKHKKWNFMLSHYPMNTTNLDDDRAPYLKVWNICGHSHTKEKIDPITNSIHCELDAWNNYPVSIEQIMKLLRDK